MCKFKRLVLGFWRWCSNVVARVRVSRGGGVHFLLKRVRSPSYIFRVNSTRYGSIRASHPRISHRRVLRAILFPMCTGVPVVVRDVLELLPLVVPADARRHRRFLLRLGNAFRSGKFLLDLRRPFRRRARVRVVTSRVVQDGHVFGQIRFSFVLLSMLFRSNKSAVFDDACKRARGKMRYTRVWSFPFEKKMEKKEEKIYQKLGEMMYSFSARWYVVLQNDNDATIRAMITAREVGCFRRSMARRRELSNFRAFPRLLFLSSLSLRVSSWPPRALRARPSRAC